MLLAGFTSASQETTERVSVDSAGNLSNGSSTDPSVSADGRYVAFASNASNLVPADNNGTADIFVHDRQTGSTERVSLGEGVTEANGPSQTASLRHSAISDDGRYVAFNSLASNLAPQDSSLGIDVFVRDRENSTTTRIGPGEILDISADGRFVVFYNMGSTGLWDAASGTTEKIGQGGFGAVSADGRYVAYNHRTGISLRDRATGSTATIQDGMISWPSISSDGRYVAFEWRTSATAPDGAPRVFVYDREIDSVREIAAGTMPEISAYGGHVLYLGPGGDGLYSSLRVIDLLTGTDESLAVNASVPCITIAPQDISGDGRFIAFGSCSADVIPGNPHDCGWAPFGTCPDIVVHDRGEQPGAPTAPPVAVESPVPVSPEETAIATPCEPLRGSASPDLSDEASPAPASSFPDPSVEAGPLASGTPSPGAINTPTSAPSESSSAVSPCSGDELSSTDDVETQTSLNVRGVAGAAVVASLLAGASAFGYVRFRRRRPI